MKQLNTVILLSACIVVFAGAFAFAQKKPYPVAPEYIPHPHGEFPLRATYAFPERFVTPQQFEWLKEAGFNNISAQLTDAVLDSCLKLGKIYDIPVTANLYYKRDVNRTGEIAKKYGHNPQVWGIGLYDEPIASQFEYLRDLQAPIVEEAPNQNAFINLLPAMGPKFLGAPDYATYVEDYVRIVNPPFISYDCYPVKLDSKGKIYIDDVFYKSLEVIKDVSLESDRPFWGFILSNKHWMYPKPTRENLRFQIFANLAYGAQGLSYFTYLHPDFDYGKWEFSETPIDTAGNRTDVWYMVRDVNRELRNLQQVFLGAKPVDVSLTGVEIPEGSKRLSTLPAPFGILETGKKGVIVSHLRNGNDDYLLLVNRDVEKKQKVRLSRSRPVMRLYPDGTRKPEKGNSLTLAPGGIALYQL